MVAAGAATTTKGGRLLVEENRSSTISSKSSELNRLADNLSMMLESGNGGDADLEDLSSAAGEDDDASSIAVERSRRKKCQSSFADRLKAAMERGNTPDSELSNHNQVSGRSPRPAPLEAISRLERRRRDSCGFQLDERDEDVAGGGGAGATAFCHQSSFSGDSSYSFEVGAANAKLMQEIEVEYEDLLGGLTAAERPLLPATDAPYVCDR